MPLIIPSNSISAGGYEVDNSLRFDDGSSDYLYRTFTTPTNNKIFTWSGWVKRGSIGTSSSQNFLRTNGATSDGIRFADQSIDGNLDGIRIFFNNSTSGDLNTTQKFRDVSAWYHIVLSVDTTQATASDRVKLYINGEQVTSFNTETYPALNHTPKLNSATQHNIGTHQGNEIFDGYMSEVVFIDGQQLDPTSFGEFDEDSGIWKPIDVSGLTFGTNGFYLDFENSGSLGADVSGNGNNFTVNNLTSIDQTTDTPTNNFATWNPLDKNSYVALSEGNLKITTSANNFGVFGNFAVSQGKWYFEFVRENSSGITTYGVALSSWDKTYVGKGDSIGYHSNGVIYSNTSAIQSGLASCTTGDIIGIKLDLDAGSLTFFKNNVQMGTTITGLSGEYFPAVSGQISSISVANFGQDSSFAGNKTRQNNQDSNGQGDFYYSPPSGYLSLNTKNLAEYG